MAHVTGGGLPQLDMGPRACFPQACLSYGTTPPFQVCAKKRQRLNPWFNILTHSTFLQEIILMVLLTNVCYYTCSQTILFVLNKKYQPFNSCSLIRLHKSFPPGFACSLSRQLFCGLWPIWFNRLPVAHVLTYIEMELSAVTSFLEAEGYGAVIFVNLGSHKFPESKTESCRY